MSQELLQVQRCPGCGILHRTSDLTHAVSLFQQPWGYSEATVCEECWQRVSPPQPVVEAPAPAKAKPAAKSRSKVTE